MRITPLVLHAAMRLPALTPHFSDPLAVATLAVQPGGNTVLTTTAPHGVALNARIAIAITDADTPNAVTAATVNGDGTITVTTQHDHDLTFGWGDGFVLIAGFANALCNGSRDLVEVLDRRRFVFRPGGPVASVVLGGGERLLERLEAEIIGWHAVTATGASTLSFPTPTAVQRAYTVLAPTVVRNIRVWGALDFATARRKFTNSNDAFTLAESHLFVTPIERVAASRSRAAKTDAIAEISAAVEHRQLLLDGFTVFVFSAADGSAGAVGAADTCQGPLFGAMLRTFNGLKLPRPELASGGSYAAVFREHGAIYYDGAVYAHEYQFQSPAYVSNADIVTPWETAAVPTDGSTPGSIVPVGAPAFRDLDFTGVLHHGHPSPLTATLNLDTP